MSGRAKRSSSSRLGAVALSIGVTVLLGLTAQATGSSGTTAQPDRISTKIVNGKATSIAKWPWQVALTDRDFAPRGSTSDRYFCTGALIAPEIVITAAHCVHYFRPNRLRDVKVIAGRTWLNRTSTGESLGVSRIVMALDSNGKRRYRDRNSAPVWDVALVVLKTPSSAPPLALAGQSESAAWKPGRLVRTTGWGETRPLTGVTSNRLRVATQVVLPDGVCRRDLGSYYRPQTMICHGGPEGNSSSCSGDSGGPLVSQVGGGWRLIGLTSFGDGLCRGNVPSVDNRTAADPVRSWVRNKTIELSGYDPVSEGGAVGPLAPSCKVPNLLRRTRASAKRAIRGAGCRLKAIRSIGRPSKGKRRVVGSSLPAGWLPPRGFGITIWLRR